MEKGPYELFRVLLRFQYLDGGEDDESWLLGKNAKDALNSREYSIVLSYFIRGDGYEENELL